MTTVFVEQPLALPGSARYLKNILYNKARKEKTRKEDKNKRKK